LGLCRKRKADACYDDGRQKDRARRRLVERLWREGVPTKTIAKRAGWSSASPPSSYISAYRAKGWDLPHRHSAARVAAYKQARWPEAA